MQPLFAVKPDDKSTVEKMQITVWMQKFRTTDFASHITSYYVVYDF